MFSEVDYTEGECMYSVQLLLKKLKYALTRGSCVPNWYFLPTSCSAATSLSVVLKAQN